MRLLLSSTLPRTHISFGLCALDERVPSASYRVEVYGAVRDELGNLPT